jgi:hypothetical protein
MHGYLSQEYIKDMGLPERLSRVERDLESGLVAGSGADRFARVVFLTEMVL